MPSAIENAVIELARIKQASPDTAKGALVREAALKQWFATARPVGEPLKVWIAERHGGGSASSTSAHQTQAGAVSAAVADVGSDRRNEARIALTLSGQWQDSKSVPTVVLWVREEPLGD